MKQGVHFIKLIVSFFIIAMIVFLPLQTRAASCLCNGPIEEYDSYSQTSWRTIKQLNGVCIQSTPEKFIKEQKDCVDVIYDKMFANSQEEGDVERRWAGTCEIADCGDPNQDSKTQLKKFELRKPILEIIIPNLKFSQPENTIDEQGNIQIPWIGEYLKAVYRFAVTIASIVGVVMIIREGLRIILSAGGEEKVTGYKHIGRIVAGLFLAWLSYVILYNVNSDLVSFRALKIKLVDDIVSEIPDTYEVSPDEANREAQEFIEQIKKSTTTISTDFATVQKPWWNNKKDPDKAEFTCEKYYGDQSKYPPSGVAPRSALKTFTCNGNIKSKSGRSDSVTMVSQAEEPLCKALDLAQKDGYEIRISNSWRPFETQVEGYCPNRQDSARARASHAVPGYSNHGKGQALDVYLFKDGKQLTSLDYWCQCLSGQEADWNRLAKYFYDASPNFFRLNIENWHFEFKPQQSGASFHGLFTNPKHCADFDEAKSGCKK